MKRFKHTTEETDQWDLNPGSTDTSLTRIKMRLYQSFRFLQIHKSHWSYSPVLRKIYVTTTIHILVSFTSSSIKNTDWQQAYKLFKNFTSFKFLSTHTMIMLH
jgi:hypothetical protein